MVPRACSTRSFMSSAIASLAIIPTNLHFLSHCFARVTYAQLPRYFTGQCFKDVVPGVLLIQRGGQAAVATLLYGFHYGYLAQQAGAKLGRQFLSAPLAKE